MSENRFARKRSTPSRMELAYGELKRSIIRGQTVPGTLLSEQQIAEELGISRTPVREALTLLESEGFVEIRRGIGAYVTPISLRDVEHIFQVRAPLEVLAAKSALQHITADDIDALRQSFHALLSRYHAGEEISVEEFSCIDWDLHNLFVRRCDNPYVHRFMESINSNVMRLQVLSYQRLNNLEESTRQHLHLLELVEMRDVDALSAALEEHLSWSLTCFTD